MPAASRANKEARRGTKDTKEARQKKGVALLNKGAKATKSDFSGHDEAHQSARKGAALGGVNAGYKGQRALKDK
jgi:hypothetical protein